MGEPRDATAVAAPLGDVLVTDLSDFRPVTRVPSRRWLTLGAVLYLAVSCAVYFPYVGYLWGVWRTVPEYTHGVLIPILAAVLLWQRRAGLRRVEARPSWWALPIVLTGSIGFLIGTLLSERLTIGFSALVILLGGVLALGGGPLLRVAWFPVVFLGFGIPLPNGVLIAVLGDPLRDQAARWSAALLSGLGYAVHLDGTLLQLPYIYLEIAYECSGLRGLVAALPVAAFVAYAYHHAWWQRVTLLILAVPIGLASNALRIVAIAMRVYDVEAAPSAADLHGLTGWVLTAVIFPALLLGSACLRRVGQWFHTG